MCSSTRVLVHPYKLKYVHVRHAVQNIVGEEPSSGDHTPLEVMEPKLCEEEGYFGSYTHFKIHDEMLKVSLSVNGYVPSNYYMYLVVRVTWYRTKHVLKHISVLSRRTVGYLKTRWC